jgi:hypothetical protein
MLSRYQTLDSWVGGNGDKNTRAQEIKYSRITERRFLDADLGRAKLKRKETAWANELPILYLIAKTIATISIAPHI